MTDLNALDTYRKMLRINKHRLDDELEIQSEIMDRISRQVVAHNTLSMEAKDELARVEGRLMEEIKEDEPKTSVGVIDAMVRRDPARIRAWQTYIRAREAHEAWVGMFDAWKGRGFGIKTLADLYTSNYFSVSSTSRAEPRRSEFLDQDGRAAIRRASSEGRESEREETPGRSGRRSLI